MRKITDAMIVERGWKELDKVFKRGDSCADCPHFEGFPGSYSEEPWSICHIQESSESPFVCPAVSYDDTLETLAAEAEEAYEASKDR